VLHWLATVSDSDPRREQVCRRSLMALDGTLLRDLTQGHT